jgi:NADPH:quinone reductase-like Zn-dependent oxidoreductase
MKAAVITRYGGPEAIAIQDMPEPVAKSGEELVRVEAAGVNFADTMAASGGYPGTPKPPLIAGREFCGTRQRDGVRVMGPVLSCCGPFLNNGARKKELHFRSIFSLRTSHTGKLD